MAAQLNQLSEQVRFQLSEKLSATGYRADGMYAAFNMNSTMLQNRLPRGSSNLDVAKLFIQELSAASTPVADFARLARETELNSIATWLEGQAGGEPINNFIASPSAQWRFAEGISPCWRTFSSAVGISPAQIIACIADGSSPMDCAGAVVARLVASEKPASEVVQALVDSNLAALAAQFKLPLATKNITARAITPVTAPPQAPPQAAPQAAPQAPAAAASKGPAEGLEGQLKALSLGGAPASKASPRPSFNTQYWNRLVDPAILIGTLVSLSGKGAIPLFLIHIARFTGVQLTGEAAMTGDQATKLVAYPPAQPLIFAMLWERGYASNLYTRTAPLTEGEASEAYQEALDEMLKSRDRLFGATGAEEQNALKAWFKEDNRKNEFADELLDHRAITPEEHQNTTMSSFADLERLFAGMDRKHNSVLFEVYNKIAAKSPPTGVTPPPLRAAFIQAFRDATRRVAATPPPPVATSTPAASTEVRLWLEKEETASGLNADEVTEITALLTAAKFTTLARIKRGLNGKPAASLPALVPGLSGFHTVVLEELISNLAA